MLRVWFEIPLWQRVVTALILGVLTGYAWGPDAESIKWVGDFFIKSIKMLVVPLIFFSLVSGVAAIGDLRKLGAVGGRAMLLFVVTGQISVWLGLALGTWIAPGAGVDTSAIQMGATPEPNPTTAQVLVIATTAPVAPRENTAGNCPRCAHPTMQASATPVKSAATSAHLPKSCVDKNMPSTPTSGSIASNGDGSRVSTAKSASVARAAKRSPPATACRTIRAIHA